MLKWVQRSLKMLTRENASSILYFLKYLQSKALGTTYSYCELLSLEVIPFSALRPLQSELPFSRGDLHTDQLTTMP